MFARINTASGHSIVYVQACAWTAHPDADDVAVAQLSADPTWATVPLPWEQFCPTPARMAELNVGIGDDVVMIGRFIGHEGREGNQPVARFGNISLMPGEPVLDGRGLRIDAFLVEMRSLPGFSGSPVFVYIGPASYRGNGKMMPFYTEQVGLIGIDTGHKRSVGKVIDPHSGQPVPEGWQVLQNSGVAIVCPYTKINEVLEISYQTGLVDVTNELNGSTGA